MEEDFVVQRPRPKRFAAKRQPVVAPDDDEREDGVSLSEVKPPVGTVRIVSLWPSRITIRNAPSGASYVWPRAGSVVEVAAEDAQSILGRNRPDAGRACCGGPRIRFGLLE